MSNFLLEESVFASVLLRLVVLYLCLLDPIDMFKLFFSEVLLMCVSYVG